MSVRTLHDAADFVLSAEAPEEDGPQRIAIGVEGMESGNSPTPAKAAKDETAADTPMGYRDSTAWKPTKFSKDRAPDPTMTNGPEQ